MSQVLALECKWHVKGVICSKKARGSGYCGKHEPRALLLEQAKKDGKRICDDGKRSCKNYTNDEKLMCEECLEKNRGTDNKKYEYSKNNLNICLGCGTNISELLDGITSNKVQRCQACYSKLRAIEDNRVRNRNYPAENYANLDKHYLNYLKSAGLRNMAFELSIEKFKEIVKQPCHYCNEYNDKEVIGIDRINSAIHYTESNCVPCCQLCNFMKCDISKHDFIAHVHKIANNYELTNSNSDTEGEATRVLSMIPPKKVAELYKYGKFNEFIEMCEKDNRHPFFIERLKSINTNMTHLEFKEWFRTCCRADAKYMATKENIKGKQVSQKEIYALLNTKNVKIAIDTYVSVHGIVPGFKDEIEHLSKSWDSLSFDERTEQIKKIMIKYRNIRAYNSSKDHASNTDLNEATPVALPQHTEVADNLNQFIPELSEHKNILICKSEPNTLVKSIVEPVQWKTSNIYRHLISGNHTIYLSYLQHNNPDISDIELRLNILSTNIKDITKGEAEIKIKTFIEDLRTARHNALCYSKNDSLLLREDREYWNSQSVLRAFNANMLITFKEYTETNTGESSDDPIWSKRWTSFVESVSNEADLVKKKDIISKFLTAQRTKKYRKSKRSTQDS
jgi:hypothetical protein